MSAATVLSAWQDRRAADPLGAHDRPLVEALLAGANPWPALDAVVRDRYERGFTFAECLGDLRLLLEVLPAPISVMVSPFDVAEVVARTFLDAVVPRSEATASGLPGAGYLAERLREAERRSEPVELAVIAVEMPVDRFAALLDQVALGHALRQLLRQAIVITELRPGRYAALTEIGEAEGTCEAARQALGSRARRCWSLPLRDHEPDLDRLLRSVVEMGA